MHDKYVGELLPGRFNDDTGCVPQLIVRWALSFTSMLSSSPGVSFQPCCLTQKSARSSCRIRPVCM